MKHRLRISVEDLLRHYESLPLTDRGCKEGDKISGGYADFLVEGFKTTRGNRILLELKLGRPLLPGMYACHTCDNPKCVAFDHLYEGTPKDNSQDMSKRGRAYSGDRHHTRMHPEKVARGDKHYGFNNPAAYDSRRGDNSAARRKPETVNRGEQVGTAKLQECDIVNIRRRYATGTISQSALAVEYNMTQAGISMIVLRKNWQHVV